MIAVQLYTDNMKLSSEDAREVDIVHAMINNASILIAERLQDGWNYLPQADIHGGDDEQGNVWIILHFYR